MKTITLRGLAFDGLTVFGFILAGLGVSQLAIKGSVLDVALLFVFPWFFFQQRPFPNSFVGSVLLQFLIYGLLSVAVFYFSRACRFASILVVINLHIVGLFLYFFSFLFR